MKVALVCDRYDPDGGGLEQWASQVVARLEARGHEVHVVAFRIAGGVRGERAHELAWHPGRLDRAAAVERALDAIAPDVVHDTGVGWRYDVLHPQAGAKIANHRRDLASLPALARLGRRASPALHRWRREVAELERRQYRVSDGLVLAVSARVAHDLGSLYGVAGDRLRLVPNGVDVERYSPDRCAALRGAERARLCVDAGTPVILFAARNPRLKGLSSLLRATARLRDGGTRLRVVVIGSEPDAGLRREAARQRLDGIVHFAGSVPDPLPCYAAADAFVLPTWYDACSLTVLEACACGLPAVTTRCNGASELLVHGRDGFVLDDPADVPALAALVKLAVDARESGRLGRAARDVALRHTLDRNVDAIENAYAEAIERRASARRHAA